MSSRDWRLYADDIVQSCGKIRQFIAGMTYEEFAADARTCDAVARNLEIVGEAAKNIPEDVRTKADRIDWRKVCGMRDVLAHGYFGLDLKVVWDAAATKIDELEAAVRALREQPIAEKPVLTIDGARFPDLAGFMKEFSRLLQPGVFWGQNLDAFNDVLRGGFGTPEGGFTLEWLHSDASRAALGYPETVRWLEAKLSTCHPSNVASVQLDLQAAREGRGQTLFEILVDIIRTHGPGGDETEDGVELVLK